MCFSFFVYPTGEKNSHKQNGRQEHNSLGAKKGEDEEKE